MFIVYTTAIELAALEFRIGNSTIEKDWAQVNKHPKKRNEVKLFVKSKSNLRNDRKAKLRLHALKS